jgi:hypothetical protein
MNFYLILNIALGIVLGVIILAVLAVSLFVIVGSEISDLKKKKSE